MADALKKEFPGIEIEMIRSSGGRFEVNFDGKLIFSKAQTGRHTDPEEVVGLIRAQQ